jgi:hypothetical protein
MPPTCTICRHSSRIAIEEALVAGTPLRTITDQYGPSHQALIRHKPHMGKTLAKAQEGRDVRLGESLADQLRAIHDMTLKVLDTAERADKPQIMLAAIREARQNIGGLLAIQQAMPRGLDGASPVVFQFPPDAVRLLGPGSETPAALSAPVRAPSTPRRSRRLAGNQPPSRRFLTTAEIEDDLTERRHDLLARSRSFGP